MKEIFSNETKNVPYPLPEGWRWINLDKLLRKDPQYGYTARATNKNNGIKFLRITDIQDNKVIWENVPYVEDYNNKIKKKYKININDFVFARTGSTTGKTYRIRFLPKKDDVIFASYLIRITPNLEKIEPKFLEYFFLSNGYWNQIITKGSSKPNFNAKKLKQILIPLPFKNGIPDLEKQKQIVEKIEAIFEKIDRAITLRQKALENTKKLFESVLNKIFKEAEEDKENWKWVKLGEIVEILDKHRKPLNKKERENKKGKYPYCGANGIIDYINDFIFDGKYLLIAEDGGFFKKYEKSSYIFEGKFWANNHVHILKIKNDFSTEYINYFFLYEDLEKYCSGATRLKLNQTKLKEIKIPLPFKNSQPDIEKQKEIAQYLDNLHNKIKQLEELQKGQLEKFKQLKESILNKAFRGKLV